MQNDKKMQNDHLKFVLPECIGKSKICREIKKSEVLTLLNEELKT